MSDVGETEIRPGDGHGQTYALYGRVLESNFPFTMPLPPATGAPDLRVHRTDRAPCQVRWAEQTPTYQSHFLTPAGDPRVACYRMNETEVLRFVGVADFYLQADTIVCHVLDADEQAQIELYLLGTVMARWLEMQGAAALHASAVIVPGGAVAFLATGRAGKSTLAATFMQLGHPLLTDDLLSVQVRQDAVVAHPGYPQMRFWPEQATHFIDEWDALPPVHPDFSKRRAPLASTGLGNFCHTSRPLRALYLLDRQDDAAGPEIKPLSLAAVLFSLVGHSFASRHINGPLHQQQRLDSLRPLALAVPARRLCYPSGNPYLSQVRRTILADLESL